MVIIKLNKNQIIFLNLTTGCPVGLFRVSSSVVGGVVWLGLSGTGHTMG